MIAGTPIVEAYDYEIKQDWVGIIMAPSVCQKNPTLRDLTRIGRRRNVKEIYENLPWSLPIQRYDQIPFKEDIFDGFVVIPRSPDTESVQALIEDLRIYTDKLDELKLASPNPYTQKKYTKAGEFLVLLYDGWHQSTLNRLEWVEYLQSLEKKVEQ